jgi:hypothetical protein
MRLRPLALVASAVGLAVLLAAPAEAAKRKHRDHVAANPHVRAVPAQPVRSTSVYWGDKYLGADPDPRIRFELYRDIGAAMGGLN